MGQCHSTFGCQPINPYAIEGRMRSNFSACGALVVKGVIYGGVDLPVREGGKGG